MQQHVAAGDQVEHRVALLERARLERRELQIGALHQVVDLDHPVEVDRAVDAVHGVVGQLEVLQQRAHDRLGAVGRDLQAHRAEVTAALQLVAQRQRQVLDLVLVDDQLGVACHPELVGALDLHPREQLVHELRQHRRQEHEIVLAARGLLRQLDDARQGARRAHDGEVAHPPERILALEHDDDVERLVEDLRERMGRVQAQRREHRHDLVAEVGPQPARLARGPLAAAEQAHAVVVERRAQHLVPAAVLGLDQFGGAIVDALEHGGGRQPVRRGGHGAEVLRMAHGRGADLEELVEVGAGNAQVAQPLQQRHRFVQRLVQHPEVEVQLRQLAVEVQRGVAQGVVARLGQGRGRGGGALAWLGGRRLAGSFHIAAPAVAPSRGSTRSAPKWHENTLPRPTSLAMSSRAWCRFSTCLTMASPKPVPPDPRDRLVETR